MNTEKSNKKEVELIHKEISEKVISSFLKVYNILGYGFLEKVYENALTIELKNEGLNVVNQYPVPVYYFNNKIGDYFADILVDKKIIVELKAVETLKKEHECQLINYQSY
jgi:GxxExxY protein